MVLCKSMPGERPFYVCGIKVIIETTQLFIKFPGYFRFKKYFFLIVDYLVMCFSLQNDKESLAGLDDTDPDTADAMDKFDFLESEMGEGAGEL